MLPDADAGLDSPPPPPPPLRSLAGRTVVATRSRAQTSALVDRLGALGATVVELPVIAIEDAADGGAGLAEAADRLVAGGYAWVAFTSANAVSRFLAALEGRAVPVRVQWAAVGKATARRLAEGGFAPTLVPPEAVSDALAEAFPSAGQPGAGLGLKVLFPRAEKVRGALVAGLEAKGWKVDDVVAYRTVAGVPDRESIAAAGEAEAVAFTSSSTVERTVALLGIDGVPPMVVSIGPVTSASARALGLEVAAEAVNSNIDGLVAAVVSALNPDPTPDPDPDLASGLDLDLAPGSDPGPA
jgi:uroporphyrinogen III methyltransferase/synthase